MFKHVLFWSNSLPVRYLHAMFRHVLLPCNSLPVRYLQGMFKCLRVENRPSVLGIFLYVPWGGVGWGGAITFTYLRTPMMLRHGTFTCTCAHTSCYVEDVSRHAGVGWGGAITFTYLRTPMMLRHGTFTCTCAHTSCKCSWKSPVGENRCVLSEDVEITGKNGCR